jgi:hypothetical protein
METVRHTKCSKMALSACQQNCCTTSWQHRTRTGARIQATCATSRKTMAAPLVRPRLGARASKHEEPKKHILGKQETKSNLVQGQSNNGSKAPLTTESLSIHGLPPEPRVVALSAAVYPQPGDISQVKCAHGEAVKDGKSPVPLSGSLGDATCRDSRWSLAAKEGAQTSLDSNVHTEHPGAEARQLHAAGRKSEQMPTRQKRFLRRST